MKKIKVQRIFIGKKYTIGKLYVNDEYICDTLEDTNRDKNKDGDLLDEGEGKIYGETCIPFGTYKVVHFSNPHFGQCLRVLNVKHFEGILIHCGNIPEHTLGCILVGYNTEKGKVLNSRPALNKVLKALDSSRDIILEVC